MEGAWHWTESCDWNAGSRRKTEETEEQTTRKLCSFEADWVQPPGDETWGRTAALAVLKRCKV